MAVAGQVKLHRKRLNIVVVRIDIAVITKMSRRSHQQVYDQLMTTGKEFLALRRHRQMWLVTRRIHVSFNLRFTLIVLHCDPGHKAEGEAVRGQVKPCGV